MIKIRRSYSINRLRLIINYLIKDDDYFIKLLDNPKDRFFYLFDKAICGGGAKFYVFYINELPIACMALSKKTKDIRFFFIDKQYRTKATISEMFNFAHKKLGKYFYLGAHKDNNRFVGFCKKNDWDVYFEDDNSIIFKICQ
jgi:hypothetical protein